MSSSSNGCNFQVNKCYRCKRENVVIRDTINKICELGLENINQRKTELAVAAGRAVVEVHQ